MEKYLKMLETIALFDGIDRDNLETLLHCLKAKIVHYNKDDIIFMAGEKINNLGIVLSGQVQIVQNDYYGNKCIIGNAEVGQLFGESFAFANTKSLPFSIHAMDKCDVLFIDCRVLITTCKESCDFHHRLIFNMLNIVAQKNIALTEKIEFISKRTTREKLVAYLSAQAQKSQSDKFSIPFNRQGLADYLNVDRSAMSWELCKLRNDGFLKFSKNKFQLLDVKQGVKQGDGSLV